MDSSKLSIKFFIRDPSAVDQHAFVPLFHEWIQTHAVADHMLIDVADYRHVEAGPGMVLVAHEGNFSTDAANNQPGLLYTRKQPIDGTLTDRLRVTFKSTLQAMELIESAPALAGQVRFRTDNPVLRIHDRLLAPNTAETFAEVRSALDAFLGSLYGAPVKITHRANPETLFEVQITAPSSPGAGELLKRL